MIPKFCFLIILVGVSCLNPCPLEAQKVTVSPEISIRTNLSYDIFPNVEDRIIFYHDRGNEQTFDIYDQNLFFLNSIDILFEKKGMLPINVMSYDNRIHFYYTYRDTGYTHIKVKTFDKTMKCVDTTILMVRPRLSNEGNPRFELSDDKSKILIFTPIEKSLHVMMIDTKTHRIFYEGLISRLDFNFKEDFRDIAVSNDGKVVIIGRKESFWSIGSDEDYKIVSIVNPNTIIVKKLIPSEGAILTYKVGFDNIHKSIAIGGFVSDKNGLDVKGYFGLTIPFLTEDLEIKIPVNIFTKEKMRSPTGQKVGKVKEYNNCKVRNLIPRVDGGVILVTEMVREFARRVNTFTPNNFNDRMLARSGLVDYYHDDIILFANFPDGSSHWDQLLFKKQFSQDDDGVFSSFFLQNTGGRLNIIYNDEIKNANTVSEYLIDPLGHFERRSILSTEYQNLKLRCRDGIQTGARSFIIPSEKNTKVNIVKVEY